MTELEGSINGVPDAQQPRHIQGCDFTDGMAKNHIRLHPPEPPAVRIKNVDNCRHDRARRSGVISKVGRQV